jgi:hypothetical protein
MTAHRPDPFDRPLLRLLLRLDALGFSACPDPESERRWVGGCPACESPAPALLILESPRDPVVNPEDPGTVAVACDAGCAPAAILAAAAVDPELVRARREAAEWRLLAEQACAVARRALELARSAA